MTTPTTTEGIGDEPKKPYGKSLSQLNAEFNRLQQQARKDVEALSGKRSLEVTVPLAYIRTLEAERDTAQAQCAGIQEAFSNILKGWQVREDEYTREWKEAAKSGKTADRLAAADIRGEISVCISGVMAALATDPGNAILDRLKAAEADSARLDKLERMTSWPDAGNGIALFPYTTTATGEKRISLVGLGEEDGSDLGEDLESGKTLREAIDAAARAKEAE